MVCEDSNELVEDLARAWCSCDHIRGVITYRVKRLNGWFVDHDSISYDPPIGDDIIVDIDSDNWFIHFKSGGDEEKQRLVRLYRVSRHMQRELRLRIEDLQLQHKVFERVLHDVESKLGKTSEHN